ncbi:MAG TPA: hypothetical protein P5056_03360 [Candidatus Paceibacterota bacterium]|nr:hypothetical protein [Candidatus Paceibacterota bacterium]
MKIETIEAPKKRGRKKKEELPKTEVEAPAVPIPEEIQSVEEIVPPVEAAKKPKKPRTLRDKIIENSEIAREALKEAYGKNKENNKELNDLRDTEQRLMKDLEEYQLEFRELFESDSVLTNWYNRLFLKVDVEQPRDVVEFMFSKTIPKYDFLKGEILRYQRELEAVREQIKEIEKSE